MKMMLYYLSVLFLVLMDYEQRDAFFSKFSEQGTEDGLFLSFFLPTAIVILFMQSCKKCGRKDVRNDRPIIVCPSAPRKSSFVSKILSPSPFCIILNLDFRSGNGRTDEMVM